MSFNPEKKLSLSGINFASKSKAEITKLFHEALNQGIHGFCYSAYEEGQEPGKHSLTEEQISRRIKILARHTQWIRSFSCIEGNDLIPKVAHQHGLKTLVGAWLSADKAKNEEEIAGLIKLAKAGYVDIAAVGNEVMYRGDLSEDELLDYINRVNAALPEIQVGYVDAYYEFRARPRITAACDVILSNCYPFWEGCHMDYSLIYMQQMYQQAVKAAGGKKVIITETGWPSAGTNVEASFPSVENAMKYFINAQAWAKEDDIDIFYFSSFDEAWKTADEGDVGAYWGIWDSKNELKY